MRQLTPFVSEFSAFGVGRVLSVGPGGTCGRVGKARPAPRMKETSS